jgi:hypothetical protein
MKNFVLLLCFCFSLLFVACSPEVQKATQKVVFANVVQSGVVLVKDKFPDSELVLVYDSLTRSYKGAGKLSNLTAYISPQGTIILKREMDWLKVTEVITTKGFLEIEKGYLTINFKKNRNPRDSL